MNIEIDHEIADKIIVTSLKEAIRNFEEDLVHPTGPRVFSNDPEADRKMIKKYLKSFKRVLNWYSGEDL